MRFLILLFLAAPALADGLCWTPVTTDRDGRVLPRAVTYQIYQNGVAYGQRIAAAPSCSKAISVPSCVANTYTVSAWHDGMEGAKSNIVGTAGCFPSAPQVEKIESAQLLACRLENTKLTLAKMTVEGNLRACQARK